MATAIKDGDFSNEWQRTAGADQRRPGALQRVMFRLTVKREAFYDQQLGEPVVYPKGQLWKPGGTFGNRHADGEEALKPMAEVTPLGVRAGMTGPDQLSLTVSLLADRKQMELRC